MQKKKLTCGPCIVRKKGNMSCVHGLIKKPVLIVLVYLSYIQCKTMNEAEPTVKNYTLRNLADEMKESEQLAPTVLAYLNYIQVTTIIEAGLTARFYTLQNILDQMRTERIYETITEETDNIFDIQTKGSEQLVQTVLAYLNYIQVETKIEAGPTPRFYRLQSIVDQMRTERAYEKITEENDSIFDTQMDNNNFINTMENDVFFKYESDNVRADAAAAITITYRGTYAFNSNTNDAGIEWGFTKKLFKRKFENAFFQSFSISRKLAMVEWQIAHYNKHKHDCKNKK